MESHHCRMPTPRFSRPFGELSPALSVGLRGRICTCVSPLRRRRPGLLGHAETERGSAKVTPPRAKVRGEPGGRPQPGSAAGKMDLAAGLSPATPRSKRGMIYVSPREDGKMVPLPGLAPGPRPSQGRVIAFSPQGKMVPAAGLAPAWSGLQNRHVAACV